MDCEDCRHLTVVGLHDTGPWSEKTLTWLWSSWYLFTVLFLARYASHTSLLSCLSFFLSIEAFRLYVCLIVCQYVRLHVSLFAYLFVCKPSYLASHPYLHTTRRWTHGCDASSKQLCEGSAWLILKILKCTPSYNYSYLLNRYDHEYVCLCVYSIVTVWKA